MLLCRRWGLYQASIRFEHGRGELTACGPAVLVEQLSLQGRKNDSAIALS